MIAEAEVGGDGRKRLVGSREDNGVIVRQLVVVVIDELAIFVHRSESAVPVEDVVMLLPAIIHSLDRGRSEHHRRRRTPLRAPDVKGSDRQVLPASMHARTPRSFLPCASHWVWV